MFQETNRTVEATTSRKPVLFLCLRSWASFVLDFLTGLTDELAVAVGQELRSAWTPVGVPFHERISLLRLVVLVATCRTLIALHMFDELLAPGLVGFSGTGDPCINLPCAADLLNRFVWMLLRVTGTALAYRQRKVVSSKAMAHYNCFAGAVHLTDTTNPVILFEYADCR